jgi:ABC-2 type transport system ATP-binding protein
VISPEDRAVVQVLHLTKRYDHLLAVDDLSFSMQQGEVFGLLGPNGAGKTTTLHILATLLNPTSGEAFVNGYNVIRQPSLVRKSIGVVFQEPSSDDILTGYENLKLHALMYGVPGSIREERIRQALDLVELTERKNDLVKKYSGGMRRRLEIARGLLHDPKVLFLDEPTLGLDPHTRETIWGYIESLVEERRITVIITTHYMEEADRLCDRVAIIDRGRIVVLDSPKNLKMNLGGDIIRLKIQTPKTEAIEALEYVNRVERLDGGIAVTLRDANKHLQEILNLVGEAESVELRSPTLHDVFLHYTGKEYREGAEGGFWERAATYRARK